MGISVLKFLSMNYLVNLTKFSTVQLIGSLYNCLDESLWADVKTGLAGWIMLGMSYRYDFGVSWALMAPGEELMKGGFLTFGFDVN